MQEDDQNLLGSRWKKTKLPPRCEEREKNTPWILNKGATAKKKFSSGTIRNRKKKWFQKGRT